MSWMEKLMMQVALVDKVTGPLKRIQNQVNQLGVKGKRGWQNMAMGTTTVVAGAMAIQNVLSPAIEMDRALGEVASLGVHEKTLKQLSSTALKFSVAYGTSATEFVSASYDIQSAIAGLEGNELPTFARASALLAKATKADTATITNYMGTMYGIFEQQAKVMGKATWVENVTGKTALAVQMFKTTGQGMADAFKGIGANATAAGISMDEQFAVLGQLQATMQGGDAGTKFKAFLAGVGNAQKELGLSFTDSAGNMLPVLTVMEKLKKKYGETLSVAEGDQLKKAFGSDEAVSLIKQLMTNTDALKNNINALGKTTGMGKAEEMAAAMTDQWQRVQSAWFAIRAAAFGSVLPAINKVVGKFADSATTVLRWTRLFPNLTKAVSYAVLGIIGLGVATGVWMMITGAATLVSLGLGLALSLLFMPVTLLTKGIRGLTAVITFLRRTKILSTIATAAYTATLWLLNVAFKAVKLAMGIGSWILWAAWVVISKAAILAFNGAMLIVRGTLAAFRTIMLAVNAVMMANPVILIVMGIIALIAAIALGIAYWDEIKAALADMGVFTALGAVFDYLSERWQDFTRFLSNLSPFQLVGKMVNWLADLINKFGEYTGITIDTSGINMPAVPPSMNSPLTGSGRQDEVVNAPLARYRQQDTSKVPPGGLGQQLIQANATAAAASQRQGKAMHIGEVHNHFQNPVSPGDMEKEMWVTTK
ncbi:phage tail tape measure protein [Aeromonas hydrophila]|uniref:phage tail tape measure protein n=1 Tax=Aeromonas hydrophila TaxID=644 RepID=UPI003D204696